MVFLTCVHLALFLALSLSPGNTFLIWLLTTPLYLKYAATLPCNLSLRACFVDVKVSQGSVATHARCDGIFNINFTANLQGIQGIFQ